MKKAFLLLLCWLSHTAYAQPDPYKSYPELRGSGKLVREDRQIAPFQTIEIGPFLSAVQVEVGGTESTVSIQCDDNFKPFIQINCTQEVLKIEFKDPAHKPFWLSKGTVRVTVRTPSLKQLQNESNGDVQVNNLTGNSFKLLNKGNGTVTLRGTVNRLSVLSVANGNVEAQELMAQEADVTTQANATVNVNARQLRSHTTGHATVQNRANTVNQTAQPPKRDFANTDLVTITFQNNSSASRMVTLRFTEPGKTIYGVVEATLKPYEKRRETYPVGTKIEQLDPNQQQIAMTGGKADGKLIITLKASDNGRTYNLL